MGVPIIRIPNHNAILPQGKFWQTSFMKFFGQLFDAPAEVVVAHGRVVLAAFSLAAITIDPTEPRNLAQFVAPTLILYAAYAVVLLAALHWRFVHNLNGVLIHAIDLTVVAMLLVLAASFTI